MSEQTEYKFMRAEDDPNVIAAIREGRDSSNIWLIECPRCGSASYYNEGSHAGCQSCAMDLSNLTDEAFTLWDYWEYEPYPVDDERKTGKAAPVTPRPGSKEEGHE